MAQRLNRVCRDLSLWGKKCGLIFNASKTVVILLSKTNIEKKKYESKKKLAKMDGIKIPFSDSVKYLGVTLVCMYVCMYRGRPSWRCPWDRAFQLGQGEGPIGLVGPISQPRGTNDTASLTGSYLRTCVRFLSQL